MWKRYTFDGYGETADGAPWTGVGIGRPWPLLSGERGEYVLANGGDALPYLQTMANTANAGYMIPEQIWDQADPTAFNHVFGKGTGSAAPLAWAMAQYVRLAQGIANGNVVETPTVVADRYARRHRRPPDLTVTSPADLSTATSRTIQVTGTTTATTVYVSVNGVKQQVAVSAGHVRRPSDAAGDQQPDRHRRGRANGGTTQVSATSRPSVTGSAASPTPPATTTDPGSYVYPTNGAFNAGSFDLTNFDVYRDGDNVRLVARTLRTDQQPLGRQRHEHPAAQRLRPRQRRPIDDPTPLLPGTNMTTAGPWSQAIVADGRHDTSTYGEGVYGPDLAKIGAAAPAGHADSTRSSSPSPPRLSAPLTWPPRATRCRCSATPKTAKASATSGPSTACNAGPAQRLPILRRANSASAAAPATGTRASRRRTPTPPTRTPWTSSRLGGQSDVLNWTSGPRSSRRTSGSLPRRRETSAGGFLP